MDSDIFQQWLLDFDREMKRQKRSIIIFMDNCSAHVKAEEEVRKRLTNAKVKFFPSNSTASCNQWTLESSAVSNVRTAHRAESHCEHRP